MKKKNVIFLIIIAVILIVAVIAIQAFKVKSVKFKEITYTEFKEIVKDKKTFGLLIEKDSCDYCKLFFPKLEQIVNTNDLKHEFYYINLTNLSEEEYKNFNADISFTGTPTTTFFKDGIEMDSWARIDGNALSKDVKSKLRRLDFLTE